MKKALLIFIMLIVIKTNAIAQYYLTSNEMISEAKCRTFECFNDFIIKRGFSYDATFDIPLSNSKTGTAYRYQSDYAEKNYVDEIRVTCSVMLCIASNNTSINYRTSNKDNYVRLLKEFTDKGFASYDFDRKDQKVTSYYRSAKYPKMVFIITIAPMTLEKYRYTSYSIELQNSL